MNKSAIQKYAIWARKELIEKAWKTLPTNKQSVIVTLDNVSRNVVSEMRNDPQHTLQYYNALSSLLDKVIVEIASRNIFDAPEGWFYSFEVTNKNAALYIRHVADIQEDEEGNVFFKMADYQAEGERHIRWFVDDVIHQHRKLETIINTLTAAGFTIQSCTEPCPDRKAIRQLPRLANELIKPSFIIFKAVKGD